jgi:Zn-dependent protease
MLEDYLSKVKKFFWFSKTEFNGFILVVLVFSFIFSFNSWGGVSFDFFFGLKNLLFAFFLCGFSLFIHHSGQRFMALKLGFKPEHKVWWPGIIVSLILVLLSNGFIKMYAASAIFISLFPRHRIGAFRAGMNINALAKTALAGPVFNVFLATFAILLEWTGLIPQTLSIMIFKFNLSLAAWNLLPIPPLDGSRILYYSRLVYVFLVSFILGYVFLIWIFNWYSYIFALLIAIICWFLFLVFFENKRD